MKAMELAAAQEDGWRNIAIALKTAQPSLLGRFVASLPLPLLRKVARHLGEIPITARECSLQS
jgi:hypothetical protein